MSLRELSLFSGCGGGLLGSKFLGWRTIGYVEREPYRCRILAQRIADGFLDDAPVYCGTVRDFIDGGYAGLYSEMVDVLSAGFPCPPFSLAGKRLGESDPRNGWPETIAAIRIAHPRFCWLENVPGLVTHPYLETICGDLREAGYRIRATVLGGIHVGAPHIRKRLWILAHSDERRCESRSELGQIGEAGPRLACDAGKEMADSNNTVREVQPEHASALGGGTDLADTSESRLASGPSGQSGTRNGESGLPESERRSCEAGTLADAEGEQRRAGLCEAGPQRDGNQFADCRESISDSGEAGQPRTPAIGDSARRIGISWWDAEPGMGRMAYGMADRVEQLEALGDGQIPAVVAAAWHVLTADFDFSPLAECQPSQPISSPAQSVMPGNLLSAVRFTSLPVD